MYRYFFCSADIFAAPVVSNASITSPSTQYGGLARKIVWVPPGEWVELPTGNVVKGGGTTTVDKYRRLFAPPILQNSVRL